MKTKVPAIKSNIVGYIVKVLAIKKNFVGYVVVLADTHDTPISAVKLECYNGNSQDVQSAKFTEYNLPRCTNSYYNNLQKLIQFAKFTAYVVQTHNVHNRIQNFGLL